MTDIAFSTLLNNGLRAPCSLEPTHENNTLREGNLEAPTRHPIDWKNPDFYDEGKALAEMERSRHSAVACPIWNWPWRVTCAELALNLRLAVTRRAIVSV